MKAMFNKLFELGIRPHYSDTLKRKIRMCNQIAIILIINVLPISFLFFYFETWVLFYTAVASVLTYGMVLILNYFYLQQYARFSLSLLPATITFMIHISLIRDNELIDAILIGNVIIPLLSWILFDFKEKIALFSSFLITTSFIFLLKPLARFSPIYFELSLTPLLEDVLMVCIIFVFACFIYILKNDTFIAENKNEIFIKELKDQQQEINSQNEELLQQQEELNAVNESLKNTLKQLQSTTSRLSKSINYAQNIQRTILPDHEELGAFFHDFFTIYLPKDIVSGDFYWFHSLNNTQSIFIMADCTGHGVPGAFMSMIANTLLHEVIVVKKIINPAQVLHFLHNGIRYLLKQGESRNTDGIDLSIGLFTQRANTTTVDFSGAKSFILYTKNGELHQLDSDRISVGGLGDRLREFTTQQIELSTGDVIYFLSDGFIDQNNAERKRFGSQNFKKAIKEITPLSLTLQKNHLLTILAHYQQEEEQRDDISVVGLKL